MRKIIYAIYAKNKTKVTRILLEYFAEPDTVMLLSALEKNIASASTAFFLFNSYNEFGTMYEDKHTPLLSANLCAQQIMAASP